MRATVVDRYGGPEVLELRDVPEPRPGPGQVAIDVAYAGVNYAEAMARRGALAPFQPPFVPGLEVSGHVRELGDGVDGAVAGEPVCALTTRGGYAEVALAPAALVYPAGPDLAAAAAMPTIVPTAWALIHELARLRPGENVLVHAAAGGVGTVVAQVARAAGAGLVLGVSSTQEKADYARAFGYDDVFVGDEWRGAISDLRIDVILDSIGGATREDGFEALAPLGRIVFYGNATDEPEVGFAGSRLRAEVKSTLGWSITALAARDPARVRAIAADAFAAGLRVDVTGVFPLAEAACAHELLESRRSYGKLVLEVAV